MHDPTIVAGDAPAITPHRSRWLTLTLSAIGALAGIAGTATLAFYPTHVPFALAVYLVSNAAWISVAIRTKQFWLLLMNLTYASLGVIGLIR
jgi:hypothetical protein